jgi:hypothetical protein
MQTFVLGDQSTSMSIEGLIQQAAGGGVEVRDQAGQVVAYVLRPADRDAWLYAEARVYFNEHRTEIEAAGARRGGVTTAELLAKAAAVEDQAAAH